MGAQTPRNFSMWRARHTSSWFSRLQSEVDFFLWDP